MFMKTTLLNVLLKSSTSLLSLGFESHSELSNSSLYDGRFIMFCLPYAIFFSTSLARLLCTEKKVKFLYILHMN